MGKTVRTDQAERSRDPSLQPARSTGIKIWYEALSDIEYKTVKLSTGEWGEKRDEPTAELKKC